MRKLKMKENNNIDDVDLGEQNICTDNSGISERDKRFRKIFLQALKRAIIFETIKIFSPRTVSNLPGFHRDIDVIKTDKNVVPNSKFNNKTNCFKRFFDYICCCCKRKNPRSDEQLKLNENDIEMALVAKNKNAKILDQDGNEYQIDVPKLENTFRRTFNFKGFSEDIFK